MLRILTYRRMTMKALVGHRTISHKPHAGIRRRNNPREGGAVRNRLEVPHGDASSRLSECSIGEESVEKESLQKIDFQLQSVHLDTRPETFRGYLAMRIKQVSFVQRAHDRLYNMVLSMLQER
jgi:hypothetical protein